jgi:hypothetical protein
MWKVINTLLAVAGIWLPAVGQELSFEYVGRAGGWFASENVAGLYLLPDGKRSMAEVYFNKGDGRLVDYFQSGNRRTWGARTGSFLRLNRDVVLHGGIEYENFHGRDMGGSTFIDPATHAFNLVEYADTNRGSKSAERYRLTGAVSADLHRGVHAGVMIDYRTANYAKHKDLRHKNTLLDLALTAGVAYRPGTRLEVGANYYYRRTVEGVNFNVYGNTDRQYYMLVDFGAFFGRREVFGESGFSSGGSPIFSAYHGWGLQVFLAGERVSLFNEVSYKLRKGYFGENSSDSPRYTDHEGSVVAYRGTLSLAGEGARHFVEVSAELERLENFENIFRRETTAGDLSKVVYYGQTKVLSRDDTRLALAYTGQRGRVAGHPAWEWRANGEYGERGRTASFYPFFRKQQLWTAAARVSAERYFACRGNVVGVSLGAGGGAGGGDVFRDGLYVTPTEGQAAPGTTDHLLFREHEYLTVPRVEARAGCAWERPVGDNVRGYARLQASLLRALERTRFTGSSFRDVTVSVGCLF